MLKTKRESKQELFSSLHELRQNYGHGITTWGVCCVDECNNGSRGSDRCADHIESDIAELLDSEIIAKKIHDGTREVWLYINAALRLLENNKTNKN